MNTLVPLCECVTSAGHLATAACLRSTTSSVPTSIAAALLCVHWLLQIRPAALFLGKTVQHLQHWEPPGVATSLSRPPKRGCSDAQLHMLHCWAA